MWSWQPWPISVFRRWLCWSWKPIIILIFWQLTLDHCHQYLDWHWGSSSTDCLWYFWQFRVGSSNSSPWVWIVGPVMYSCVPFAFLLTPRWLYLWHRVLTSIYSPIFVFCRCSKYHWLTVIIWQMPVPVIILQFFSNIVVFLITYRVYHFCYSYYFICVVLCWHWRTGSADELIRVSYLVIRLSFSVVRVVVSDYYILAIFRRIFWSSVAVPMNRNLINFVIILTVILVLIPHSYCYCYCY